MTTDPSNLTANALHAAEVWLARLGATPNALVTVDIFPKAAVGLWVPGKEHVGMLPAIDDAGAELCEACGPAMFFTFNALKPPRTSFEQGKAGPPMSARGSTSS